MSFMKRDPSSPLGREGEQTSETNLNGGSAASNCCSPRKAGVVIRASVEHVGVVGDTELTVNVKWPASTFCVQPCEKPAAPCDVATDSQNVPCTGPESSNFDALYGEAAADPDPIHGLTKTPGTSDTSENSGSGSSGAS